MDECTGTIVGEVESLKALVDEFSHFARMPSPRTVSVGLNPLLHETLLLYDGLFDEIRIEPVLAQRLPPVKIDPELIRRVVINLVDNAVDVLDGAARGVRGNGPGVISLETQHDASRGVVRLIVADNGPGIAPADRDKLFLPYFSTKRRGSGLGLAIVRRIRRRAWRQYRGQRQPSEGNEVRRGAAGVEGPTPNPDLWVSNLGCEQTIVRASFLVVDDEAGVRSALSGVLRDEGYLVEAVESGEACLDRVARDVFDVNHPRHLVARDGRPGDPRAAPGAGGSTPRS